jgi:hypothetical protein
VFYDLTLPNEAGPAAERGTFLHEEAEIRLRGLGKHRVLDEQDEHIVKSYVDYVNRAEEDWEGSNVFIEQELKLNDFVYGTADAIVVRGDDIRLIDLKTGAKPVHAKDNTQLMIYLLMAVKHFGINVRAGRMTIEIVQPFTGAVSDVYEVSGDELRAFDWNVEPLINVIKRQHSSGEWSFRPSYEACHYCQGKAVCRARREDLMSDFSNRIDTDIEDAELSDILKKADQLKSWIEAVEAYALKRACKGLEIDGFELGQKNTFRKWTDPESAMQILVDFGFSDNDEVWSKKLASPARILNAIDDEILEGELSGLIVKPEGAPVLKRKS